MTSFVWKRKSNLRTSSATAFDGAEKDERDEEETLAIEGVDWLTAAKKRRLILLEDNKTKSRRRASERLSKNNCVYFEYMWPQAPGGGRNSSRERAILGGNQVLG